MHLISYMTIKYFEEETMLVQKKRIWISIVLTIAFVLVGLILFPAHQGAAQSGNPDQYHNIFYKDYYGYNSTLYLQNVSGATTTITLTFNLTTVITRTISPWGGLVLSAEAITELTSNTAYNIYLHADQPIQSVVETTSSSDNDFLALYQGMSQGETQQYFGPFYQTTSALSIWNVSDTNTTVTMTIRKPDGSQADELSTPLMVGSQGSYLSAYHFVLPSDFEGWSEVNTLQPVVSLLNNNTSSHPDIYAGALATQAPYAMPRVHKEIDEGVGLQTTKVFVGNTVTASNLITGTYYAEDGSAVDDFNLTLPGKGCAWADPLSATLPATGTWAVMVTSTYPIAIGEQNDYVDTFLAPSESYESAVGTDIALPHLTNTIFEYTIFSVQNTSAETATTEIIYYDLAGNAIFTESVSLPPVGWARYDLRQIPQLDAFIGSAIATADQPLRAWVDKYLLPVSDVSVNKSLYSSTAPPGGTMQYSLDINNNGNLTATNVILTDIIPNGLTYESWSSDSWQQNHIILGKLITETVNGQEIIWPIGDLAIGRGAMLYLTVRVSDTLSGGERLTNTVSITTDELERNTSNNESEVPATIDVPEYDIDIWKSSTGAPLAGQEIEYTISCYNDGNMPARDILITDTLPGNVTYVSHSTDGFTTVQTDTVMIWQQDVLSPYDSSYIYLTVRITDTAIPNDWITNTVQGSIPYTETDYTNNAYINGQQVVTPTYDMYMYKNLYSSSAPPEGTMQYRLYLENQGNSPATHVVLTDTLPAGLSYISWGSTSWSQDHTLFEQTITETIDGQNIIWDIGEVAANEYANIYLTVRVDETLRGGDIVTNTAVVTMSNVDSDPGNNEDEVGTTIAEPRYDMRVNKYFYNGTLLAGEEVRYRIYYNNDGNVPARSILITDTLPGNVTYVSDYADGFTTVQTGTTVIWQRDVLSTNVSGYIYLTVRITDTASPNDWITNTVRVSIPYTETDDTDNASIHATQVVTPTRDMYVSKNWSSGNTLPGQEVKYRLYFQNEGNSLATNVIITDILPHNLTYISWSTSQWGIYHDILGRTIDEQQLGNQIVWAIGDVEPWGSEYIYLTARITDTAIPGDWITNTLHISAHEVESEDMDNESLHATRVITPTRDMQVTKSLAGMSGAPGGRMTYNISYNNSGNSTAHDILITDTLPAGVTYLSDNAASQGFTMLQTGTTLVWYREILNAGSSNLLEVTVQLTDSLAIGDWLTNTVEIGASDIDIDTTNNVDQIGTQVLTPTRDMFVNKSWYSGAAVAGAEIAYYLYFENNGNMPASNVVINDTLPEQVTYISWSSNNWTINHTLFNHVIHEQQVDHQITWHIGEVAGGQSGYIYVNVRIADDVTVGAPLTNTADIATSDAEADITNNQSTVIRQVIAPTRDVRVTKIADEDAMPGDTLKYVIYFYNDGNSTAHDVMITDTLPVSLTYVTWTGEFSEDDYFNEYEDKLEYLTTPTLYSDGRVVWHLKELVAGEQGTIYLTTRVTDTVQAGETLANTIEITCAEPDTDPTDNSDTDITSISDFTRDLYGDKGLGSSSPPPVPGNYIEYRIYFSNNGTATAHGVVITDTLPITVEYDSWWGYMYSPDYISLSTLISPTLDTDRHTLAWYLPPLVRDGYGYFHVRVRVKDDAEIGDELVNEVTVSTSDVDIDTEDNSDHVVNTVVAPETDVYIMKSLRYGVPGTPGGWMAYQIYFGNAGNITANNVIVSDTLPADVSLISWDGYLYNPDYISLSDVATLVQQGQTLSWNLGELVYDAYGYINLWVQITDTVQIGENLDNVARVTSGGNEATPGDNVYTLTTTLSDKQWNLWLYKENEGKSAAPGGAMQYYISYDALNSNWPLTNVVLTDTLPPGATLISWYGSGWHPHYVELEESITFTQTAEGKLIWNLGTLGQGSHGYLYLTIQLETSMEVWDPLYNQVELEATEGIWAYSAEKDRVTLPQIDLTTSKYLESAAGTPGGQMIYRLYFANNGNMPTSNVMIADTLPDGVTFASWYGELYTPDFTDLDQIITPTQSGNTLVWNISNLPVNAHGWIYPTVNISAGLTVGEQLTNVVEISSDSEDSVPTDNRAVFVTTLVGAQADLSIAKTIKNPIHLHMPGTVDYNLAAARYTHLRDMGLFKEESPDAIVMTPARQTEQGPDTSTGSQVFQRLRTFDSMSQTGGEVYLLKENESRAGIAPGQEIQYSLYFKNQGNVPVSNVVVTDTLPAHTDYVSWYGYVYAPDYQNLIITPTISGNQIIWNIGTLGIDHYGYIYPTARVTTTATPGMDITNRADIVGDAVEEDMTNNTSTVTTTVTETVNYTPTANAGVDQTVQVSTTVTLDASGSSDPDGDTLTYGWTQSGGPAVTLSDHSAVAPTFTASTTGTLTFHLTVTDTGGLSDSDNVVITVTEEAPPCQALTGVTIDGRLAGYVNTAYTFHTTIAPVNATQPVAYTWSPSPNSGQGTATAIYTWSEPGSQTFQITAENCSGTVVTDEHTIEISALTSVSITVEPGVGGILVYTDPQGLPTTVEVPAGAVTGTLELRYTPVSTLTSAIPTNLRFANHAFDLEAYRNDLLIPGFTFSGTGITITITYSDNDIAGLNEGELKLYYWDVGSSAWVDAATTCPANYIRQPELNKLGIPICHLSRWGIMSTPAEPSSTLYLPLVLRNAS